MTTKTTAQEVAATTPAFSKPRITVLQNNYTTNVGIASTDTLGKNLTGDDAVVPGDSGLTGEMKVPMAQGVSTFKIDGHHIALTSGSTTLFYIWKRRSDSAVLYSSEKPSSDADGQAIATDWEGGPGTESKQHFILVIAENGDLSLEYLNSETYQNLASSVQSEYEALISQASDALSGFYGSEQGQGIIKSMKKNLNSTTFDPTDYCQQVLDTSWFSDIATQSSSIGPTMSVGVTVNLDLVAGWSQVIGAALDLSSSELVGYVSEGFCIGADAEIEVGFQVGFWVQPALDMGGVGYGATASLDIEAGGTLGIYFNSIGEFAGLTLEIDGGIGGGATMSISETVLLGSVKL